MPSYICEKCGTVDNSACGGTYYDHMMDNNILLLCVECSPITENYKGRGKWHNVFPKSHWSEIGTKEEILQINKEDSFNFQNAKEYFKNLEDKNE